MYQLVSNKFWPKLVEASETGLLNVLSRRVSEQILRTPYLAVCLEECCVSAVMVLLTEQGTVPRNIIILRCSLLYLFSFAAVLSHYIRGMLY